MAIPCAMDALDAYIVSQHEQLEYDDQLREWELAMALGSTHEKVCHSINILNGVPVVPMALSTKESKGLLDKLRDATKQRVYSLHRMIMVMYTPSVLRTCCGTLALRIVNRDTGESIVVVADHPVSQAAVFVCRWPRAILAQSSGLALVAAVDDVPTKRGSLVGVLSPYWEDKMSTRMVYERELPPLVYPLEEQEPAFYVKNMHKLRAVVASRVHLGGRGADVDSQPISTLNTPRPIAVPALTGPGEQVNGGNTIVSKPGSGRRASRQPKTKQPIGSSCTNESDGSSSVSR